MAQTQASPSSSVPNLTKCRIVISKRFRISRAAERSPTRLIFHSASFAEKSINPTSYRFCTTSAQFFYKENEKVVDYLTLTIENEYQEGKKSSDCNNKSLMIATKITASFFDRFVYRKGAPLFYRITTDNEWQVSPGYFEVNLQSKMRYEYFYSYER